MAQQQNIPVGYMQSDVGVIPADWSATTIGASFDIRNTLRLPISEDVRKGMRGKYPYYGPTKIQDYINEYRVEGEHALIGEDGDHFLKWDSISMTQLATGKFNVNNHAHIIKGKQGSSTTKWFYYYFKHRDITPHLTRQGAGRYKLSKASLSQIPCALPNTIVEQEFITSVLSDVDSLITKLSLFIQKKRDIRQGAMQELLSGKRRLPGFSGEWEEISLEKLEQRGCIRLFRGKVISKKDMKQCPGNYPIYSSSIHNNGKFGQYGRYMFDEELITWSVDGGGDFFYRPKHKFSVTNVCGYIRLLSNLIKYDFLALQLQLLHSRRSFDYTSKAHPSVIRKAYGLKLPKPDEQTAIARILSDMKDEIESLEKQKAKYTELKQGMMQQLLTGKIRLTN